MVSLRGLSRFTRDSRLDNSTLDLFLRLFTGHNIPAIYRPERQKWGAFKGISRRSAFAAHLVGEIVVGSYPFMGLDSGCGCSDGEHVCVGKGSKYLCVDVDAHNGETDALDIARAVKSKFESFGVGTLGAASRSGKGVHLYAFFDAAVDTASLFQAGTAIVKSVGAYGRCDVISSAGHPSGYGTLHALPLHPGSFSRGGGYILDNRLSAAADPINELRRSDVGRACAEAFLESIQPLIGEFFVDVDAEEQGTAQVSALRILKSLVKFDPRFQRLLENPSVNNRSCRDARIASTLARHGLDEGSIAQVLILLDDTKSAVRGQSYAKKLAKYAASNRKHLPVPSELAAMPCRERVKRSPWGGRIPPPLEYGDLDNPWWDEGVQKRLKQSRTGAVDGKVLAYLVDRWFKDAPKTKSEECWLFEGVRTIAKALDIPYRTVASSVKRIREKYADVVQVSPGKKDPVMRVATAFTVLGIYPGHTHEYRLYSVSDEYCDEHDESECPLDRHVGLELSHVTGRCGLQAAR